jgi:hypothetical protein
VSVRFEFQCGVIRDGEGTQVKREVEKGAETGTGSEDGRDGK